MNKGTSGTDSSRASKFLQLKSSCAAPQDTKNLRTAHVSCSSPRDVQFQQENSTKFPKKQASAPTEELGSKKLLQSSLFSVNKRSSDQEPATRQKVINECANKARSFPRKPIPDIVTIPCSVDSSSVTNKPNKPHVPVFLKTAPEFVQPRVKKGSKLKLKRQYLPSVQFLPKRGSLIHERDNMGNILCGVKQKPSDTEDSASDVWVKRIDHETSHKSPKTKHKKYKKKEEGTVNKVEYPRKDYNDRISSTAEVLERQGSKQNALYDSNRQPEIVSAKGMPQVQYRVKTLPTAFDASEIRRSIGDPMDFRMADDISSASTPTQGQITPEPPTPPMQKSPISVYRRLHQDKQSPSRSAPTTPRLRRKAPKSPGGSVNTTPILPVKNRVENIEKIIDNKPPPGVSRARDYILPSPPSRPKFRAGMPIGGSPNVLRKYDPHPSGAVANSLTRKGVNDNGTKGTENVSPNFLLHNVIKTKDTLLNDDSAARMLDENEMNLRREEINKLYKTVENECNNIEKCKNLEEILVDQIVPKEIESTRHEAVTGPKIAVLSTGKQPEQAILSVVPPPPSPSTMDAFCEEVEEEEEIEEFYDDIEKDHRERSKEIEEFGGQICQRLSQLLDHEESDKQSIDIERSPLNAGSPGYIYSGLSSSVKRSTDNSDSEFRISPMPRETEMKLKEIASTIHSVQLEKQPQQSTHIDRTSVIIKSPMGSETSDMDNDFKNQNNSKFLHQKLCGGNTKQVQTESDIDVTSSDYSSSEYSSESDYSDELEIQPQDPDVFYEEGKEYFVPWDLRKRQISTESFTDQSLDLSDNFEERVLYARPWKSGTMSDTGENTSEKPKIIRANTIDSPSGGTPEQRRKYLRSTPLVPTKGDGDLSSACSRENFEDDNEYYFKSQHTRSEKGIEGGIKRESDILCDVIGSYHENLHQELYAEEATATHMSMEEQKAKSKLDKSIHRIFTEQQDSDDVEDDCTYNELAPLQSLIQTAEESDMLSNAPLKLRLDERPRYPKWNSSSRRSISCTESDIEMSETGPDDISEDMDADDEDDFGMGDETSEEMDNERNAQLLNSRLLRQRQGHVLLSQRVLNSACLTESDNDSVFTEDEEFERHLRQNDRRWLRHQFNIPPPPPPDLLNEPAPASPPPEFREQEHIQCHQEHEHLKSTTHPKTQFTTEHIIHDQQQQEQLQQQLQLLQQQQQNYQHQQQYGSIHLSLPVSPKSPQSPISPPPWSYNSPQNSLDLASTYRAISPKNKAHEVAFDDACQQMQDIHQQLQQLKQQMHHFEEDKDSGGSTSSRRRRTGGGERQGVATD